MKKGQILVGNRPVGNDEACFVVAEIGINHNGSLALAKKLIDAAVDAGADAVKFQKRTVSVVYSEEELQKPREVPAEIIATALERDALPPENVKRLVESNLQETTNGDLKRVLEFTEKEYAEIDRYCKEKNILWFASPWDEASVDFLEQFDPLAYKVASASLTDDVLLQYIHSKNRPLFLSVGMSTLEEVDHAVEVLGKDNLVIMHCVSTYPAELDELNLKVIHTLQERYGVPIGYSGHESGVYTSLCAAVLGAVAVERHITLDRSMWGSDQAASLEPKGLHNLVTEIRNYERARGDGIKKVLESEVPVLKKLRRK
ncbi:N-acetylneuraminate synthase family protein [Patescibacteria group bacterium]|nr:N-acetylneuraminate synthase family protein [Patescibacteria group bacterium]